LAALKLSEDVQKQLSEAFQTAAKPLGDDEVALKALQESFEATGKQLAEQIGDRVVTLSIQMPTPATPVVTPDPANPAAKTLSEDDVKRILSDAAKTQQEADSATAKKLSDNQALFDKKLAENESYKALSEPAQKKLSSARELINAEMSADQITRLAENQLSLAADMAVSTQLASMGYQVAGNAHITVDDSNSVKALQETVDQRLGISTKSKVKRFSNTGGELQTENITNTRHSCVKNTKCWRAVQVAFQTLKYRPFLNVLLSVRRYITSLVYSLLMPAHCHLPLQP